MQYIANIEEFSGNKYEYICIAYLYLIIYFKLIGHEISIINSDLLNYFFL
jgi:hypothetical protein